MKTTEAKTVIGAAALQILHDLERFADFAAAARVAPAVERAGLVAELDQTLETVGIVFDGLLDQVLLLPTCQSIDELPPLAWESPAWPAFQEQLRSLCERLRAALVAPLN